jgi:TRAP-type C4-dicarboxylate transport system permease small subunit
MSAATRITGALLVDLLKQSKKQQRESAIRISLLACMVIVAIVLFITAIYIQLTQSIGSAPTHALTPTTAPQTNIPTQTGGVYPQDVLSTEMMKMMDGLMPLFWLMALLPIASILLSWLKTEISI